MFIDCIKVRNYAAFLLLWALGFLGLAGVNGQSQSPAKPLPEATKVPDKDREAIEKVVREYLIRNPSVLREAIEALQAQEEKERIDRASANLKARKDDIYSDIDSPVGGNPNGDVTIVAFFDYSCGYCKSNLPEIERLVANDSRLRIIYKEFPILGAESAEAARAALAANRQGKYLLFHQAMLKSKASGLAQIRVVARRVGLNFVRLQQEMADAKVTAALGRNFDLAAALGIDGTPAYLVGDRLISGAADADAISTIIAAERARLVQNANR